MRHFIVRAFVLLSLAVGATYAYAVSTGPPAARTGAFAVGPRPAELNCTQCHSFAALNSGGGSVQITGVPAHYVPGVVYPITVQLQHPRTPVPPDSLNWGFQLQAVQASTGDSAGIWVLGDNFAPDTFRIVKLGGTTSPYRFRRYIEHTREAALTTMTRWIGSIRRGQVDVVTWTLLWQAPPGDSGKIYFFAAGNAANGDFLQGAGSPDYIYTTAESTLGTNVDVPPRGPYAFVNALEEAYPNPMSGCTNFDFSLSRGGLVNIGVFDLQGRRVRTLLNEFRPVGVHSVDWDGRGHDGAFVRNGVYFVRMLAPGEKKPFTQKVTMSR